MLFSDLLVRYLLGSSYMVKTLIKSSSSGPRYHFSKAINGTVFLQLLHPFVNLYGTRSGFLPTSCRCKRRERDLHHAHEVSINPRSFNVNGTRVADGFLYYLNANYLQI